MSNLIGNLIGRKFRFKSSNFPDSCFRHRNFEIWLNKNEESALFKLDSSFTIVPGLSGSGISFKSENYPDHFIRHQNYECYIHKYDGQDLFKKDASWIPREGLGDNSGYSFESVNYPGFFMRHRNYRLRIDRIDGSDLFMQDATWLADQLKDRYTYGVWKLVYGNDNEAADWVWSEEITVGIEVEETSSVSTTEELAWKVGMEGGTEAYGISIKAMFEASGMKSVTRMSSSTWKHSHNEKKTKTFSGKRGQGLYLWQWNIYGTTADGVIIGVASDLYDETEKQEPPEPLT
ncbi:MAG TPA: AbfB domain-containing protein [Stenomitos sp.]